MKIRFAETLLRNVPPGGDPVKDSRSPMSAAIDEPGVAKITSVLAPSASSLPTRAMICDGLSPTAYAPSGTHWHVLLYPTMSLVWLPRPCLNAAR